MSLNNFIKLIQRNQTVARFLEDSYCRVPYYIFPGRALSPLSVVFLATYKCNLRCKMCFYYNESEEVSTLRMIKERGPEELSRDQVCKLIDDLSLMKVKVFTIHGGEPLLYKDFFKIAKYSQSKGLLVNFVTNGTLISEDIAKEIVAAKINHITFSIDGPENIHDKIRNVPGTFSKMLSGIKNICALKEHGYNVPGISISTYLSAINQAYIVELAQLLYQCGVKNWGVGLSTYNSERLAGFTREILGIDNSNHQGSLEHIADDIIFIDKEALKKQRRDIRDLNRHYKMDIYFPSEKAIDKYDNPSFNEAGRCFYPWARVVISPYGEVFPCINLAMVGFSLGNIKDEPLSTIWNSQKFREFRGKLKARKLLPICSKCCTINGTRKLRN